MAATPEGKVKADVRKLLDRYQGMWYYMPVSLGYGKKTVDFIGCFRCNFFAIETKAEGKKPTMLQAKTLADIGSAGGNCFVVIAGTPDIEVLETWLETINGGLSHLR